MKPIYFLTNKGTKWTHPILFNSISFSYKKAKCQNNRVCHTLHLPIVTLFKIWQWTCLVKQLLCPCIRWSKVWPYGAIFRITLLPTHLCCFHLKMILKLMDFWQTMRQKLNVQFDVLIMMRSNETHWITQRTTLPAPVNKTNTIVLSLWKGVA